MKQIFVLYSAAILLFSSCGNTRQESTTDNVKTTFQSAREWRPTIDNRADAVMVYGVGGNPSDRSKRISFEDRVRSWQERGYITHFMTGIAWGEYQDYFTGEWDGKPHLDEGQVTAAGDTIWHGYMVPYIVPSMNYLEYIKENHVKRVIDAGIDAIFMEEPEFWARAGYSESFKREWQEYYGFAWRPQHESPENTYLSNKLKYHLYYRALDEVFTFAKEYGRSKGMDVKCYVPTHSLVNYSQWQIVSPEASLASLPCVDGYIAQVWTGTSREPNYYNGKAAERVFETAYLEYGSMESMTAPTGRKMFFLTDPIEDRAKDWEDYRRNYQATFTAQLLYPGIADYEIMPWPERIYEGLYRISPDSDEKARIPRDYSAQMQIMVNSLNSMPVSENRLDGAQGIAVLMANSLMFQRFPTHEGYEDPQLSNFYGQALPLLKRGIPVKTAHIENVGYPATLSDVKVLLMSYSNMKPLDPQAHSHIADWVKEGGVLLYSGRDDDPFQTVREWWNTDGNSYAAPSDHLFKMMGIPSGAPEGEYSYGEGTVYIMRHDPKEYVLSEGGDRAFVETVGRLYSDCAKAGEMEMKNSFYLERGPYTIAAVMNESISDEPLVITGTLVDLFDPGLPVYGSVQIEPGHQGYYIDIDRVDCDRPQVLAGSSRAEEEHRSRSAYSFTAKSPIDTDGISRVLLPEMPSSVTVNGKEVFDSSGWDAGSSTYLLTYSNSPDGVKITFQW